ncbi:protein of unknown function [Taphrina deformans PYCC 5710]|uniref:Ribosomal eL28/Mak16 domain-containing protein n=1 Tax=Taphrina deformans (strain PYCC 5710 / ATCC 11124 / CBS 356.35 / IMI 108563 / JCM 9778 / NBRC 8474) TaxID=1097556 RepID=R4XG02_TAPDE|nr:protein of unknown function [Taphrina deformans PYCC 5710]|eukprot:CCG84595.1 protein of unknown function [Taphrina deformans PYCC 5710]
MVATPANFSNDLLWLCIRDNSSFIVKRPNEKMFSREPMNLTNKHTAKYSGLANNRIIGVQPSKSGKGVTLYTKSKPDHDSKPAKTVIKSTLRNSSAKGISQNIYNSTIKKGYRVDLRYEALARGSACILASQPKKDTPAKKTRGTKA